MEVSGVPAAAPVRPMSTGEDNQNAAGGFACRFFAMERMQISFQKLTKTRLLLMKDKKECPKMCRISSFLIDNPIVSLYTKDVSVFHSGELVQWLRNGM